MYFTSLIGRQHQIVGIARALDLCSCDSKQIVGLYCVDLKSGNLWTLDIRYYNPIKNNKLYWKRLLIEDRKLRDKDGYFYPTVEDEELISWF